MNKSGTFYDSPALLEEIRILKNMIRLLDDKNHELEMKHAKTLIKDLPELPSIKKQAASNSEEAISDCSKIADVYRKSNELLKDFYSSMVNIKVPDITKDTSAKKQQQFNIELQTNIQLKHISKAANEIQNRLSHLRSEMLPGSQVTTPLNTFQAPEVAKAIKGDKKLVAEITMPCAAGRGKVVDLHLNNDEIKDIFKTLNLVQVS